MAKLNRVDEQVVAALKDSGKELTLGEVADKVGESEKKVFKSLRKLFENEMIECQNRRYKLANR